MVREYPYLVAGLPQLMLDAEVKGFDIQRFKDELKEGLHPDDYADLEWFFYPVDNWNLISFQLLGIKKHNFTFMPGGKFTYVQMEEGLKNPGIFPPYMEDFIQCKSRKKDPEEPEDLITRLCGDDPVKQLLYRFYGTASRSRCPLIRDWYAFEHALYNLKAALSARRLGRPVEESILPGGHLDEALLNNKAADFGLRGVEPWIDAYFGLLEIKNSVEREKRIDLLRWKKMDDLTETHYIDVYLIHAFMMKAFTVVRWILLDETSGQQMFGRLLKETRGSYNLQDAFDGKSTPSEVEESENQK